MSVWLPILLLCLLAIIIQAYFTMMEMSLVSFNRVKLQYFVSQNNSAAKRIARMLRNPTYLFGTTLIGVNVFLQIGSELSRNFYSTIGVNPDIAPITQIFLVVVFAELTPMFVARSNAERIASLGIAPLHFISKLLTPIIWVFDKLCKLIDWIFSNPEVSVNYLTREELQRAVESKDAKGVGFVEEEFDTLVGNIFEMKNKFACDLMVKKDDLNIMSHKSTVGEVKKLLLEHYSPFVPVYQDSKDYIFGILYTRDILVENDEVSIEKIAKSAWFITDTSPIVQIVKHFRWNNQNLAVVLDKDGNSIGILTLDSIISDMFHSARDKKICRERGNSHIVVNKTFPSTTDIAVVNSEFNIKLTAKKAKTLEDLMTEKLGRPPQKGEAVCINGFEFVFENVPLMANPIIRITSTSSVEL